MRKMKDSGIEWIGEIPSDWDVTRIGYESWIRARLGWKGLKAEEYVDDGFAFLSAFNIVDDKLQWENLNFINQQRYDESPEIKLKKGDILLVKDGAGIGKCARIDSLPIGAATTNGSLAVISTHAKLSYRYLYFYLLSPIFQNYIYRLMNGMGVPHLSQEELRKIQIPFPPIDEQKKIADFLDEKCGEIDSIRSDVQREIEILNDYKKSVITEAVTKGLNSKAKLKDSGIEWIGKIPEGWITKKLKYLTNQPLQYGANESGCDYDDSLPRYIRITDISMDNKLKDEGKLSLEYDKAKPYLLEDYDLLFARSGASVGKTFLYKKEYGTSAFAGYLIKASLDKKKVSPKFVYYNTLSCCYESWKQQAFTQATIQNIGAEKYNTFVIPVPPLPEQKAIADYLDEKCSEIEATIADKQRQLETLDEYKKSLIFEYVTGKKEVPA